MRLVLMIGEAFFLVAAVASLLVYRLARDEGYLFVALLLGAAAALSYVLQSWLPLAVSGTLAIAIFAFGTAPRGDEE
jgi:hypothetical protein